MKTNKSIKWVVIFTFALGYIVSAWASGNVIHLGGSRPEMTPIEGQGINDVHTATSLNMDRWKTASIETQLPQSFRSSRDNALTRPEALKEVFDILCRSGRALRVVQLGDSHVAGKSYPEAVKETLEQAWGNAGTDSTQTGIDFSYMGKNGATASYFATNERLEAVAGKQPDLIILSFGTNECHGMGYREEQHREQLETFYARLKEICPDAVVMLTTPPGDYLSTNSVHYVRKAGHKRRRIVHRVTRVNPMTARCASELESFGKDHGLAVWNLNAIAGGEQAVSNWYSAKLMRPDRIHYTPEGYALHGKLLGEAILAAYNNYVSPGA